jgi:hypothetical protein
MGEQMDFAQRLEQMKQDVRTAVDRLVADFPEASQTTASASRLAELFYTYAPPTDENGILQLSAAKRVVINDLDETRQHLDLNRRLARR